MDAARFVLQTLSHAVNSDGPPPGVPASADTAFETTLARLCEEQRVAALISRSLRSLALPPSVSRVAVERLRRQASSIASDSSRRIRRARELHQRLAQEGVRSLVFGDIAASAAYPEVGLRPVDSIEFLIDERETARALHALDDAGFHYPTIHPVFGRRVGATRLSARRAAELVRFHHYFAPLVLVGDSGERVRLRYRVIDIGAPEAEEAAWARARPMPGDPDIQMPGEVDCLVDAALRFGVSGLWDLCAAVDAGFLVRRAGPLLADDAFDKRLRSAGVYTLTWTALDRVRSLLVVPPAARRIGPRQGVPARALLLWWHPRHIRFDDAGSARRGRVIPGMLASAGPAAAARWLRRHLTVKRRWIRNRLGGRPGLWQWLKFQLVVRDVPMNSLRSIVRSPRQARSAIELRPDHRRRP